MAPVRRTRRERNGFDRTHTSRPVTLPTPGTTAEARVRCTSGLGHENAEPVEDPDGRMQTATLLNVTPPRVADVSVTDTKGAGHVVWASAVWAKPGTHGRAASAIVRASTAWRNLRRNFIPTASARS
jgi:hypothetical protein